MAVAQNIKYQVAATGNFKNLFTNTDGYRMTAKKWGYYTSARPATSSRSNITEHHTSWSTKEPVTRASAQFGCVNMDAENRLEVTRGMQKWSEKTEEDGSLKTDPGPC